MEVIAHGLTGLLVAGASVRDPQRGGRASVLAGALGPDLDVIAGLWDPLASITIHRLATHSLVGGVPLALLAAWLIRSFRGGAFWRLAGLAYLGLLSHVVLDLFTPFGTGLLWPLDPRRWAIGSLYVIDPIVTLIVVASLLPSAWWKRPALGVAKTGLLALLAYLLLGTLVMNGVETRWKETLALQGTPALRATVVPTFPGPFRWLGVAEGPSGIVRARFWVWKVDVSDADWFEKERPTTDTAQAENHPAVQSFLRFAKFPWRRTLRQGETVIVEYHELAFEDHPFGGPMVLRLRVDPSGAAQGAEWGHRL